MKKSNQVRLDDTQILVLQDVLYGEVMKFYDNEHKAFIHTTRNQEVMALFAKINREMHVRGLD